MGRDVAAWWGWIASAHRCDAGPVSVWLSVHHGVNYRYGRRWMAVGRKTDAELSGELEAVATAAADRLQAVTDGDLERDADLQGRVGEAASRAIAAGLSLASIADAEKIGQGRAPRGAGAGASATGGACGAAQARGRARVRAGDRPRRATWPRASRRRRGSAGDARHRARDHRPRARDRRAARRVNHDRGRGRIWAAAGRRVRGRRRCGQASVSRRHAGWDRGGSERHRWRARGSRGEPSGDPQARGRPGRAALGSRLIDPADRCCARARR